MNQQHTEGKEPAPLHSSSGSYPHITGPDGSAKLTLCLDAATTVVVIENGVMRISSDSFAVEAISACMETAIRVCSYNTAAEEAKRLKFSKRKLQKLVSEDGFPVIKIPGHDNRFDPLQSDEYMNLHWRVPARPN